MSLNLNIHYIWNRSTAIILTLAQDEREKVHVDRIKNIMSIGGTILRR